MRKPDRHPPAPAPDPERAHFSVPLGPDRTHTRPPQHASSTAGTDIESTGRRSFKDRAALGCRGDDEPGSDPQPGERW